LYSAVSCNTFRGKSCVLFDACATLIESFLLFIKCKRTNEIYELQAHLKTVIEKIKLNFLIDCLIYLLYCLHFFFFFICKTSITLSHTQFILNVVFFSWKQITVYVLMYKTLGMSEISKGSSYGAADMKKK